MMIGYACSNLTLQEKYGITPARSCRIATLLKQDDPVRFCVELARQNLADSLRILRWNKEHGIYMYRLSASMFPFATHKDFRWSLDFLQPEIEELGVFIRNNRMRVSSHLPQFINLGSPNSEVVKKSILDLECQTKFLDMMRLGPENKIIIHVGGVYEDRTATANRFIIVYKSLPENIRARLVVENDEKNWTIKQIMKIHKKCGITVLFDYLHWQLNHEPDSNWEEDLKLALSTWKECPKIHYSEQDPDKNPGAHSFYIKDIITGPDFDTMVEAKGKEKAILPFIQK